MKKIGTKIFLSYISIIVIIFLLTTGLFNIFSDIYLKKEVNAQLQKDIKVISSNIDRIEKLSSLTNLKNLDVRRNFGFLGRIIKSELVVLDRNGKMLYSDFDVKPADRKQLNVDKLFENHIYEKIKLESGFTVYLGAPNSEFEKFNNILFMVQGISILISSGIVIIIAKYMQSVLVKPLKELKNKMENYEIDRTYENDILTGDEIEILDKTFVNMSDRINVYNKQRKMAFQNASHELKTPLMSIQGYAEAIKDGIVEGDELTNSLDIIIKESQRLKGTVDTVILINKLEDNIETFNYEKVDLSNLILDSIAAVGYLAKEKNVDIEFDANVEHIGDYDADKIIRAFINILSNGIRYANSKIKIDIFEKENSLEILIKDDGKGIDNPDRVFERFYKGEDGNTGLGLAITKIIIEGHNGGISAYNSKDGGAVFNITLSKN
ncbi:MAG: HAMP domain-containing histidine kinase [Clostridia bacterium]|jgi:signal transduction histidine kinase|nr:HAMP domain-containing histidine kinase [Clostridia bacterium]